MYMWRELDVGEVRDELAHIASMGFDTVRVFVLAEDFLPARDRVNARMVSRLVDVAGIARDAGLSVVPTLLVFNMSGRIWWPPWMHGANGRPGNIYDDVDLLRAQAMLVSACARALAGDDAIRAFDIANEIDDAQRPFSRESGCAWIHTMATAIREAAPGALVRIGAHLPTLTTVNHMRADDLAGLLDEDVMHAYPLYSDFARSFLDPELVPFACALTAGLSGRGRSTLMQEFGLCTAPPGSDGISITDDFLGQPRAQYLASEAEGATYYEQVVHRLVETDAGGAYAWCYADYDAALFHRPPLDCAIRERTFGLVRADGSEKPAAAVFRALRAKRDAGALVRGSVPTILDVTPDAYYQAPGEHFGRLYATWTAA